VIDGAGTAEALTELKLNGVWEVGEPDVEAKGETQPVDKLFQGQAPTSQW
jgi:hypothetical protein